MTDERWPRVKALFQAAVERPIEERDAFLAAATGDDTALRREVESLLASDTSDLSFLERLPVASESLLLDDAAPSMIGRQLGSCRILSLLGAGGMGEVYRARDTKLNREVALKILPSAFALDADRLARFRGEARAVAALNHPHIVTIFSIEEHEGVPFITMELVEGCTLDQGIPRDGLPLARFFDIAIALADALSAAHRKHLIHRDLKPANVMVTDDGHVKVLDFGLARVVDADRVRAEADVTDGLTGAGILVGTMPYMSPEQIETKPLDHRTDLFALGIMLYELATGERPFRGDSPAALMSSILRDHPRPVGERRSDVPAEVCRLIDKCLEKEPRDRIQTAPEILAELKAHRRAWESEPDWSTTPPAPDPEPLRSIAVLPFVLLSDARESRTLSLGFADALITILGNLADVRVSPTSAILNYPAGVDPERVCRELDVRFILQGTVQSVATTWRVSIQLFDGTAQRITLAEKHDFTLDNVFDVQDEIGRVVVASLQSRFPSALTRSRDRYSDDPDAYNDFMAGLRESSSDQPEQLRVAAEHLSSAVTRDPDFALAHALLSFVSMNIHFQFDSQRAWLHQAEEHCRRALAIDPALPEGHLARSWILWSPAKNFQHAEAIAALEQVLTARPNLERAHNRMSTICSHIGLLEESRIAHEHALRCNPQTRTGNLEIFYIYSGDFARAEVASEAWYRERPGNPYAQNTRLLPPLLSGKLGVAEQRLAEAMEQRPDDAVLISTQGMLHAWRHETELALECVRRSMESPRSFGHTHHTYYQIACVYAVLGHTEKALAWLERSVDTGFACWPFFRLDPHLASLQQEPAFTRLTANLEQTYTAIKIHKL